MFAKLVVLILSLALGACALLAARQMRTQAAHELATARLRILECDARLWLLRARIASMVTPDQVESLAARMGGLQPMIFESPLELLERDRRAVRAAAASAPEPERPDLR